MAQVVGFGDEISDPEFKLSLLQNQFHSMKEQKKTVKAKLNKLDSKIQHTDHALSDSKRRSTLPSAVINFVVAIEKANLYFDFKDAAKQKHAPELRAEPKLLPEISDVLLGDEILRSQFKNISEQDIWQAAKAIYLELYGEKRCGLEKKRIGNHQNIGFKKMEDPALVHKIYKLVFQAREQVIVMDQDPELELEKIMKSDPNFYDINFRPKVPPVEHSTTSVEARNSYAEFWSKYDKVASDAKPCVENVEDVPLSETDLSDVPQTESSEELALKKKLQKLEEKTSKLLQQKKDLKEKLTNLLDQINEARNTFFEWRMRSALPSAVIHFVAAIEKANLYFDFKEAAKDRHLLELRKKPKLPSKIFDTLNNDEILKSKFNKIQEVEIRKAAIAICFELCDERQREREEKHTGEVVKCGFEKREDPALANQIYRLVHQTREQDIVLDRNAIVELEKIMISDPCYYNTFSNLGNKPVDGLATTEAAQKRYSEFWSKYVKAANHAEPEPEPGMEMAKDDLSSSPQAQLPG